MTIFDFFFFFEINVKFLAICFTFKWQFSGGSGANVILLLLPSSNKTQGIEHYIAVFVGGVSARLKVFKIVVGDKIWGSSIYS